MKIKVDILCQKENDIDSQGDLFIPEALKMNDGKEVPLLLKFNPRRQIGNAILSYKKGEGLFVSEIKIMEREIKNIELIKKLKPALKGKAKIEKSENGLHTIIKEVEVLAVGCVSDHSDPSIKTFGESKEVRI